jgi:hypothetical protein
MHSEDRSKNNGQVYRNSAIIIAKVKNHQNDRDIKITDNVDQLYFLMHAHDKRSTNETIFLVEQPSVLLDVPASADCKIPNSNRIIANTDVASFALISFFSRMTTNEL